MAGLVDSDDDGMFGAGEAPAAGLLGEGPVLTHCAGLTSEAFAERVRSMNPPQLNIHMLPYINSISICNDPSEV